MSTYNKITSALGIALAIFVLACLAISCKPKAHKFSASELDKLGMYEEGFEPAPLSTFQARIITRLQSDGTYANERTNTKFTFASGFKGNGYAAQGYQYIYQDDRLMLQTTNKWSTSYIDPTERTLHGEGWMIVINEATLSYYTGAASSPKAVWKR